MQQQGQNTLNSWFNQFQEAQNWPFKTYDAMMAPFGRNIGSQSTTSGPAGNPVAGLMGGAMMGSKIGGMFGTGQPSNWASSSGWGTGNQFGNQDYGMYF